MLILLGSSIGMMETEIPGYKCPLYGRRTGQLKLEPLRFRDISYFFPGKTTDELVKIYGCLDLRRNQTRYKVHSGFCSRKKNSEYM
jgi:hypothetical protein